MGSSSRSRGTASRDPHLPHDLLDHVGQGYLLTGESRGDRRILACNTTLGQLFDLDPATLTGDLEEAFWNRVIPRCSNPLSVRADLVRIQGRPQEMRMDFLRLDEPRELVLERFTAPVEDPVPGPRGGRVWLFRDVTRQEILKDRLKRRAALEEMLRYLATELISASPESGMVGDALPLLCRAAGGSGAVVWLLDDRQRARPAWQWTHARAPEADAGAPELSREATRALLDTLGSPWDRARVLLKGEVTDPALAGAMGDRHAAAWLVSVIRSPERLLGFLVLEAADEVPVRWERDELRFFSAAASIFGAWVHKEQMFRELKAAREEAESAAAARTDFIALVSHELRTPLNPLVGFTQVLEESCRCDDESRRDMIRRVREAATRLLELVEDLLTLTRLDGRLDSWRKYPVDVGTLVDVARGALERFVEGRSLEISTSFEGESGFIHADGAAVRRALKALLSNAVRFTPDGGRVLHRIVAGSDVVTFEVTDTGPGVAPDRVEDIFSPFVQEQPLLTRRHGGAGLGLTLVRRIAEAHGGSVSVRNGEAGGAIFTLVLPRYAHEEEDTQP